MTNGHDLPVSAFGLRHYFVIRHSCFVIHTMNPSRSWIIRFP